MGSKSYGFTGDWQRFTVPRGVKAVVATLNGAGSQGVAGGRVAGRIEVKAGQTLWMMVGAAGRAPTTSSGAAGTTVQGGGGRGGDGSSRPGTPSDAGGSGGGASVIRLNSAAGTILAVAGGAGGTSGDGGRGGLGGANVGQNGWPGVPVPGTTAILASQGNATGGTQLQGGNGGTSGLSALYDGSDALDAPLAAGGAGGGPDIALTTIGGGGGGGGYHPGGGGQAGMRGESLAGGGGGGSNFAGGIGETANAQGGGSLANGSITLSWTDPAPANQPPSSPTEVKLAGVDYSGDEHATRTNNQLAISAKVDDPSASQQVRLVVVYSSQSDFSAGLLTVRGTLVAQTHRSTATLTGLQRNTRYWARLFTEDSRGLRSNNYTSVNFWTNRSPLAPVLVFPSENSSVSELDSVVFQWDHVDPDSDTSKQSHFDLRWRVAATPLVPAGEWTTVGFDTWFNQYVANPGTFTGSTTYEWQVRTTDAEGAQGPWSVPNSFFVTGPALAPLPTYPLNNIAVDVTRPVTLAWRFRDPDQGDAQTQADLRWRPWTPDNSADWVLRLGSTTLPGTVEAWTLPANTFAAGVRYQWQVRTTDTLADALSDWSRSGEFWGIRTPGSGIVTPVVPDVASAAQVLSSGNNRAFIFRRGGTVLVGEIPNPTVTRWGRVRDDISAVTLTMNSLSNDTADMLRDVHTWMHEVVIFRNGKRVWEGPITRIEDGETALVIEGKDVWAWVYRRIMRQGYNDAFRVVNGEELGTASVVQRALAIVANALAPDDPNILPYLTALMFPDDAGQSRVVPDFSKTAWEEVDDMAATAGLDYTAVGRRPLVWDTHRPLGRLPEMRSQHFSSPPVITEYGMQLATAYGVTNNSGIYGLVEKDPLGYGLVELLASAYGETEGGQEEVLTSEARLALQATLASQATRGIASRYPAPAVVRVPDGSTLDPEWPGDINHLVPGVWIPLRAKGQLRNVAQWQKLDVVDVTQDENGERVAVTMSPAPNGGADPDADSVVSEA